MPDLLCVFVSGADPDACTAALERAAASGPAGAVLGCSAGGVLGGATGVEGRPAVSVFAAVLPGVRLRSFHLEVMRAEAGAAVVGMPELDGYETCRRLRLQEWGRSAFIVAMTGWGQEEDVRRSRSAGFDEHLVKPVDPERLRKVLMSRGRKLRAPEPVSLPR